jgi:putative flippase GtrA
MTNAKRPERRTEDDRRQKGRRLDDILPAALPDMTDLSGWLHFVRQLTYMRYLVVSVTALAVDMGLFLLLLQMGVQSMAASAIGYSVGIFVHWFFSSRKVFQDRVSERGSAERTQQKAMFVMSALLGLATTTAIVGAGEWLGADPRLAKLVAIGISFQLTYLLRNVLIFRTNRTV